MLLKFILCPLDYATEPIAKQGAPFLGPRYTLWQVQYFVGY